MEGCEEADEPQLTSRRPAERVNGVDLSTALRLGLERESLPQLDTQIQPLGELSGIGQLDPTHTSTKDRFHYFDR